VVQNKLSGGLFPEGFWQYSKVFKGIQRYSKIFKDIQRYPKIFKIEGFMGGCKGNPKGAPGHIIIIILLIF